MDAAEKTPTPELSKRVLDNQKDAERLASMGRQHAVKIGEALAAALGPAYAPMAVEIVTALTTRTGALSDAMVRADVALTVELADDAAPRISRDRHERAVRDALVDVRERLVGLYGQGVLSSLCLASAAPRDARQLVTYAERAADAIEKVDVSKLPEPRIEGAKATPKKWASLLRKPAAQLKDALGEVEREAAEAVSALVERNARRDALEAFAPRASDLLGALLRFGGMDAEAERLARPVGVRSREDDTAPANDPATPPANDPQ